jgi:hypothetical protein
MFSHYLSLEIDRVMDALAGDPGDSDDSASSNGKTVRMLEPG